MPKGYKHLTYDQRCQISALLKRKIPKISIANDIGIHRSTLTREINRNSGLRGYRHKQAQRESDKRRALASSRSSLKMTPDLISAVHFALENEQWSPDQISGTFKRNQIASISAQTIYRHIWTDKRAGGKLFWHLRHRGKKYNKRGAKNAGRGLIPGRVDIDQRPGIVEEKSRLGDWEIDTIIGKNHIGAIVSLVDRASKYTRIHLVPNKKAGVVSAAIVSELKDLPHKVHTLTADNGKEFAKHAEISASLNADVYFAKPYASWQRGLNEHTNGLIRQYFPKKTRFDTITQQDVKKVEILLNTRPRRILNFKTPAEVFFEDQAENSNDALHV
jgi:IS30 family transposase